LSGTGSIAGVVLRADTNETLSRARIDLVRADSRSARVGDGRAENTVTTDEYGRFVFDRVGAGRYLLSAARNQFVRLDYGRRGRNELGTVLILEAGEDIENLTLRMFVAPTISGAVTDPYGRPLVAATVAAYRRDYGPSGRNLALAKAAVTDDHGEYRLFWLNPGDYYVLAGYGAHTFNPMLEGVELTPNLPVQDQSFTVVYYPSAAEVGDAEMVRLSAGLDSYRDIRFREVARRRISGYVVDAATNRPIANANVMLLAGSGHTGGQDPDPIKTNANGYFSVPDAAAGKYLLYASAEPQLQAFAGRNAQSGAQERATAGRALYSELQRIDISASNADALVLPVVPGTRITGGVQFEGLYAGRGGPAGGTESLRDVAGSVVNLLRKDGGIAEPRSQGIGANGAFAIDDVPPGRYDVSVPTPSGYYVRAMRYAGLDILSAGLHVRAQDSRDGNLDIVFGVGGTVNGRILERASPVAGAQVILVPDPNSDAPRFADRYRIAATDSEGNYAFRGVAPGRYLAFVFEEIDARFYFDPEFLLRFGNRGVVAEVREYGIVQPELKVVPASETEAWYRRDWRHCSFSCFRFPPRSVPAFKASCWAPDPKCPFPLRTPVWNWSRRTASRGRTPIPARSSEQTNTEGFPIRASVPVRTVSASRARVISGRNTAKPGSTSPALPSAFPPESRWTCGLCSIRRRRFRAGSRTRPEKRCRTCS
jgi:hypothetical protein